MANGLYLRLSIADGDLGKENKDESNSIDNQRSLLVSFITDREDIQMVVFIPKYIVPIKFRQEDILIVLKMHIRYL